MKKKLKLLLSLEIVWWLATALILFGTLYPILAVVDDFPFFWPNILSIITLITLGRHIFLLRFSFLANLKSFKIVLFFLSIPFVFFLFSQLHAFRIYTDEVGLQKLLSELPYAEQGKMIPYIKNEFIFFGVGAIISAVIFPFRMLMSVWRMINRGTV